MLANMLIITNHTHTHTQYHTTAALETLNWT